MKIHSEKLEEIRERVESMAIENDYARKNLEFELVVSYVFELEHERDHYKSELFKVLNGKISKIQKRPRD